LGDRTIFGFQLSVQDQEIILGLTEAASVPKPLEISLASLQIPWSGLFLRLFARSARISAMKAKKV
jgi:hypothetical protein